MNFHFLPSVNKIIGTVHQKKRGMVRGWRGEERRGEGRIGQKRGEEQGKGVGQEQGVTYQSKKRGGDARGEERTRGEHMVDGKERRGEGSIAEQM